MARTTPRPMATQQVRLCCTRRQCPQCAGPMWFAYENRRKVSTLEAVLGLRLEIRRCINPSCSWYHRPQRPEAEGRLALPHHEFGLDVIAWIGRLRYREQRSVGQIQGYLQERGVRIAERTVEHLLARYEELVSVGLEERARRCRVLKEQGRVVLALDGLQPDKGHEVLWVVREVLSKEVLLARPLLGSSQQDLEGLLREALRGVEEVAVVGVISDGEVAIRKAVAAVLPGVAHQLCQFHYLREAGRPLWEADRQAKKELKKPVRGVRALERQVEGRTDAEAQVIQGYCAAVRGALTDEGQPPLQASGLRLHDRLSAIAASLERVAKKGGLFRRH